MRTEKCEKHERYFEADIEDGCSLCHEEKAAPHLAELKDATDQRVLTLEFKMSLLQDRMSDLQARNARLEEALRGLLDPAPNSTVAANRIRAYETLSEETPDTPDEAYTYACNLARALQRKFYPEERDLVVLPDTLGVLTQIDNMTTGLVRRDAPDTPSAPPAEISAKIDHMREGLKLCAQWFREYADNHMAKETEDGDRKAQTNIQRAELCEQILGNGDTPPAQNTGPTPRGPVRDIKMPPYEYQKPDNRSVSISGPFTPLEAKDTGPRVKPLEWTRHKGDYYADTPIGEYGVGYVHGRYICILRTVVEGQCNDEVIGEGECVEDVQERCQAHYQSIVRECLEETPDTPQDKGDKPDG